MNKFPNMTFNIENFLSAPDESLALNPTLMTKVILQIYIAGVKRTWEYFQKEMKF